MYPAVTAFAETHEVAEIVRAAFRKRFDVMNFFNGSYDTFCLKTYLAVRMRFYISAADFPPLLAVAFSRSRIAVIAFVLPAPLLCMLLAVGLSCRHELRAARVAAGFVRFIWHIVLLRANISPQATSNKFGLHIEHFLPALSRNGYGCSHCRLSSCNSDFVLCSGCFIP